MEFEIKINTINQELVKLLYIKKETISNLSKNRSYKSIVEEIMDIIEKNGISFPFRRYYWNKNVNLETIKNYILTSNKWNNIHYTINDQKRKDGLMVTVPYELDYRFVNESKKDIQYYLYDYNFNEDYWNYDIITEYWIEFSRIRCFIYSDLKKSPYVLWNEYNDKYLYFPIYNILKNKMDLNPYTLRENLYSNRMVKECAHEKVTFITSVIRMLVNPGARIFDACIGWGDRILASYLSDAELYVGVDPNTDSYPCFLRMVNDIGKNYKIHCDGMPEVYIEEKNFDLAFISPPNYDSEFYGNHEKQSINVFKNREDWSIHFLYKTIYKTWSLLKEEGYLIIQSLLAPEINAYISFRLENVKYLGCLSVVCGSNRNKPLWIFKKTKNDIISLDLYRRSEIINHFTPNIKKRLLNNEDII